MLYVCTVPLKAISNADHRPDRSLAQLESLSPCEERNVISTAQPAKSSGNHPASSRQSREALAWCLLQGRPSKMVFMHFISLVGDQLGKGNQGEIGKINEHSCW